MMPIYCQTPVLVGDSHFQNSRCKFIKNSKLYKITYYINKKKCILLDVNNKQTNSCTSWCSLNQNNFVSF